MLCLAELQTGLNEIRVKKTGFRGSRLRLFMKAVKTLCKKKYFKYTLERLIPCISTQFLLLLCVGVSWGGFLLWGNQGLWNSTSTRVSFAAFDFLLYYCPPCEDGSSML